MKTPMLSAHISFDKVTDSASFPDLVAKNRLEASAFIGKLSTVCRVLLEPVWDQFGSVEPTSGYSCPALNHALGRNENSEHAKAQAVDFTVPGKPLKEVFDWYRTSGIPFGQLILEPHCIHVSLGPPYRPEEKCGQVLIQPTAERKYISA